MLEDYEKCAALTLRGRAPALPYLLCFIIPGWKGVFKMLQYMLATDFGYQSHTSPSLSSQGGGMRLGF
jgi:hypothetical protein